MEERSIGGMEEVTNCSTCSGFLERLMHVDAFIKRFWISSDPSCPGLQVAGNRSQAGRPVRERVTSVVSRVLSQGWMTPAWPCATWHGFFGDWAGLHSLQVLTRASVPSIGNSLSLQMGAHGISSSEMQLVHLVLPKDLDLAEWPSRPWLTMLFDCKFGCRSRREGATT